MLRMMYRGTPIRELPFYLPNHADFNTDSSIDYIPIHDKSLTNM